MFSGNRMCKLSRNGFFEHRYFWTNSNAVGMSGYYRLGVFRIKMIVKRWKTELEMGMLNVDR